MNPLRGANLWERRASLGTRIRRVVGLFVHLARVRLAAPWVLPRVDSHGRQDRARRWAARALDILNVRLVVTGTPPLNGAPALIVANHISWLDVQALSAVRGARFVAKSEVRRWPLVGQVAEQQGTLFIRRGSVRDAWRTKNQLASLLQGGEAAAIFPEGTTSDGRRVLQFYPALLQAAVDARTPVYPVTIRYQTINRTGNAAAAFVGDMTFADSLLRVVREPVIAVHLHFGTPIPARSRTRRELAALAQLAITEMLALATDDPLRDALRPATPPRLRLPRSLGRGAFPPAPATTVA